MGERTVMVFALYRKPHPKPFTGYLLTLWSPDTSQRGLLRPSNHAAREVAVSSGLTLSHFVAITDRIAGKSKSDRTIASDMLLLGHGIYGVIGAATFHNDR